MALPLMPEQDMLASRLVPENRAKSSLRFPRYFLSWLSQNQYEAAHSALEWVAAWARPQEGRPSSTLCSTRISQFYGEDSMMDAAAQSDVAGDKFDVMLRGFDTNAWKATGVSPEPTRGSRVLEELYLLHVGTSRQPH